jgi:amidohydrolase
MTDALVELRRRLHRCAELSGAEEETARVVREAISSSRPAKLIEGIGGHGVAAVYEGGAGGPTLLLRCDMDALPIDEGSGLAHHSRNRGVAHKCGHDGHMTMMLGLAEQLGGAKLDRGRLVLLFQPAEEVGRGARAVIEDGRFAELRPDMAVAVHNLPGFELGAVIAGEGAFACASRGLKVAFHGASSHAAEPDKGRSPALAVAQTIQAWSAGPQIATGLLEAAQATVVHALVGSEAFGTSPAAGSVAATLRGERDEVVDRLEQRLLGIARGIGDGFELNLESERTDDFPATVNDPQVVQRLEEAAAAAGVVVQRPEQVFPWSEDFGHFTRLCPGALVGLGAGVEQPPLHHPTYDFPDALIPIGVAVYRALVGSVLGLEERA